MELKEVWKDIQNYPNYQVSNFGNIKSKKRYVKQKNGMSLKKERILKPQKDKKGYYYVRLYNDKGWKYFKIHHLVAKTFIENLKNKPTVDHIDRNKSNNCDNNLRWASYIEQANNKDKINIIKHMKKIGKIPYKNRAKKVKQYDMLGNFVNEWDSSREASLALGISETSISNCVVGYTKSAGGYIWRYVNEERVA